jgi:hypothetical protein
MNNSFVDNADVNERIAGQGQRTARSLTPSQELLLTNIETLSSGWIMHLEIRDGCPCYDNHWPRIIEHRCLSTPPGPRPRRNDLHATLSGNSENLLQHLQNLSDSFVDIEVWDGIPIKVVVECT